MKLITALAALVLMTSAAFASSWSEDFDKASSWAKAQNKYMLVDFTGSDWCGWCKRLDKEVFAQKEFQDYADANLICVSIDFPMSKPQSEELKKKNQELQQKFNVSGYPTIFILSPEGETVAQTGYRKGGAQAYVDYLKGLIDAHKKPAASP